MRKIQSFVALVCVMLLLSPLASGQQPMADKTASTFSNTGGPFNGLVRPYTVGTIPPINLANSSRLDSLLRAGRLYLSLQDAIALALENNLDIAMQRYGPAIAQADLMRAQAGGLLRGVPATIQTGPSSAAAQVLGTGAGAGGGGGITTAAVSSGGTLITATGTALPNLDPVFFTAFSSGHTTSPQSNTITTGLTAVNFNNQTTNIGVSRGFLTGTNASLGWNNSNTRSNNPLADINPNLTSNIQLQLTQHLLQGFGYAVNNRNIKIAQNGLRIADIVFKEQVITTVAAIVNLYWNLVAFNEDVKVKQEALSLAQKLYDDNKKQVDIGTLAPIEIVRAEAQVASSQQDLTISQTRVLQQETIIKNALSRTGTASPTVADARIVPTDSIQVPQTETIQPIQDMIATAMQNRPELLQTQINLESTRVSLKGDRSQLLPALDLQVNLQNNGLVGTTNTLPLRGTVPVHSPDPFFLGGFGSVLGQVFRRNFPNYSLAFQLNVPLRNRSAQSDMIRDQLTLRQQELQQQKQINQVRTDVQNALIGMQQARAQYQTAVKARVLQEQTLDAEQKKYQLGASTLYNVILTQRDLSQARSNEVSALATYSQATVQMDLALGQVLDHNHVEISEAMTGQVTRPPSTPPNGR